ncbi:1,4-dihydroxy-2-naphthoate prenyltransferase [Smithella sp. F21]|nr:1,4-dihydroxy-2-naphthoate prenyltransferase [Smithella sp. F21]HCX01253.1 1,4-dihydroxy-2-naphthoate polyprenyltransferase [Syntrophaceae bacterium]
MSSLQFRLWALAIRPKTLPAVVSPVIVGTAMTIVDQSFKPAIALAALAGALLLQIGANLANDYFDCIRGVDGVDRLGPIRVTQSGLISAERVKAGMIVTFIFATIVGLYLIFVGGWPILLIGVVSILSALAYSGGPYPLASHGFGDIFVFVFFGPVAVCGTYYVQTLHLTVLVVLLSIPVGLLVTAILVVNNLRDIDTDGKADKYTLAVIIGKRGTRIEYAFSLITAYIVLFILWITGMISGWGFLLPMFSLPVAICMIRIIQRSEGILLNQALARTAGLSLVFSLLLSIGLIISCIEQ